MGKIKALVGLTLSVTVSLAALAFTIYMISQTDWNLTRADRGNWFMIALTVLMTVLVTRSVYGIIVVRYFGGFRCPNCRKWFMGRVVSTQERENAMSTTITVYCKCRDCQTEWSKAYTVADPSPW